MRRRNKSSPTTLAFGDRLKALRKERGLSMHELALASDLSSATICHAERGSDAPTVETVAKLARGLGLPPMYLMIWGVESSEHERHAETLRALTIPAVRASRESLEAKHRLI